MKIERKVKTLTAQGRMQGLIVSAMPVFLGLIMTLIKPQMMIPYLTSFLGIMSVLVMSVLIFIGWMMIRKIIKIDV